MVVSRKYKQERRLKHIQLKPLLHCIEDELELLYQEEIKNYITDKVDKIIRFKKLRAMIQEVSLRLD
jgi:hypothetical protein